VKTAEVHDFCKRQANYVFGKPHTLISVAAAQPFKRFIETCFALENMVFSSATNERSAKLVVICTIICKLCFAMTGMSVNI